MKSCFAILWAAAFVSTFGMTARGGVAEKKAQDAQQQIEQKVEGW